MREALALDPGREPSVDIPGLGVAGPGDRVQQLPLMCDQVEKEKS